MGHWICCESWKYKWLTIVSGQVTARFVTPTMPRTNDHHWLRGDKYYKKTPVQTLEMSYYQKNRTISNFQLFTKAVNTKMTWLSSVVGRFFVGNVMKEE